jgi:hypothetical protein
MKYYFVLLVLICLFSLLYLKSGYFQSNLSYTVPIPSATPTSVSTPTLAVQNQLTYIKNVPFAAQAPFGNWKDPLEQNGCEEAAATIAVYWAKDKLLTKQLMLDEIKGISDYEIKTFGNSVDTSASDTISRLFIGYYKYLNVQFKTVSDAKDIITWLNSGYLVITPMNGQKILNHNYTPPGPERHMLVIRGYDPKTGEFITNDAGTRLGENFRYPKELFFNAIRDYPSGDHQSYIDTSSKSAILVWK